MTILMPHHLPAALGKKRKRVGRGNASRGTYSGRGIKGQRARSGGKKGLKLRGLKQTMLHVPKMSGFQTLTPRTQVINLQQLEALFAHNAAVGLAELREAGCVASLDRPVKILGKGKLSKALRIQAHAASQSAQAAIEQAGGTLTIIPFHRKK